jgi:hypothetical protein
MFSGIVRNGPGTPQARYAESICPIALHPRVLRGELTIAFEIVVDLALRKTESLRRRHYPVFVEVRRRVIQCCGEIISESRCMPFNAASRCENQHAIVACCKFSHRTAGTARIDEQLAGTWQAVQHARDIFAGQVRTPDVEFIFVIVVTPVPDQIKGDLVIVANDCLEILEVSKHLVTTNFFCAKYTNPPLGSDALCGALYRRDLLPELFRIARLSTETFYYDHMHFRECGQRRDNQ